MTKKKLLNEIARLKAKNAELQETNRIMYRLISQIKTLPLGSLLVDSIEKGDVKTI